MVLAIIAHLVRGLDWRATGDLGALDYYAGDPQPLHFKPAGALICHRCGVEDRPDVHLCEPGGVHHAAAACTHCGCWLRWLPKPRTEEEQVARREKAMTYAPPSQAQLAFLAALGETTTPASMKEASDLIERRLAERAGTTAPRRKRWGIDN